MLFNIKICFIKSNILFPNDFASLGSYNFYLYSKGLADVIQFDEAQADYNPSLVSGKFVGINNIFK